MHDLEKPNPNGAQTVLEITGKVERTTRGPKLSPENNEKRTRLLHQEILRLETGGVWA